MHTLVNVTMHIYAYNRRTTTVSAYTLAYKAVEFIEKKNKPTNVL